MTVRMYNVDVCCTIVLIILIFNNSEGMSRNWIQVFKQQRGNHSDRFVVETNKLIIRLDKLMSPDAPTDPNKRKGEWEFGTKLHDCTSVLCKDIICVY